MNTYVVTNPENGWDCVTGVYQAKSEKALKEFLLKEAGYDKEPKYWNDNHIIHSHTLIKVK